MSDYSVIIKAQLQGFDAIESKLKSLQSKNIDVKVNLTGDFNNQIMSQLNGLGNKFQNSGKIAGAQFSSGFTKSSFTFDTKSFAKMKSQLQNETNKIAKEMQPTIAKTLNGASGKEIQKAANQYAKQYVSESNKETQRIQKEAQRLQSIREKEFQSYGNSYRDAYQSIGKKSEIQKQMSEYYRELEISSAKEAQRASRQISKIQENFINGSYDAKLSTMKSKLSTYSGQSSPLLQQAQQYATVYEQTLSNIQRHFDSNDAFRMNDEQVVKSFNNMNTAAKGFANTMTQVGNVSTQGVTKLSGFAKLKSTAGSFFNELGRGFKQIAQFSLTYGAIQKMISTVGDMVNNVIEVDSAMTELKKVSEASASDVDKYFESAAKNAKDLGSSISDVISSTADWSRLGYTLKESEELAKITTLYQNVGDNMTQQTAAESLISTLKGFQLGVDDADHIIDSFNEVGNHFAIGSDGIGEALRRSASSMSAAGNTLEETIGLVTAANTVVQDPASVGTAFKTISMRIRGAETEMEQLGLDTDGMVESTAKLQEEILALTGIDIMKDKNAFKSTYQILDELSTKWSELTDIQQASVTELIAGKRQGNVVSALMQNFDIAREATETAMNSDDSAMKEQKKYEKSIQFSMDRMKAQFQDFSNTAIGSDFIKGIVDGGNNILNVVTQLIKQFGILKPLITGIVATKGISSFIKNFDQPQTTGCPSFPIFLGRVYHGGEYIIMEI